MYEKQTLKLCMVLHFRLEKNVMLNYVTYFLWYIDKDTWTKVCLWPYHIQIKLTTWAIFISRVTVDIT